MNRSTAPTLVGVFVAALLLPQAASAYVTLKNFRGNETKWSTNTVPYYIDSAGDPDLPFTAIRDSISAAFGSWEGVGCSALRFTYSGVASGAQRGGVYLRFESSSWDPTVGDAAAYTMSDKSSNGTITASLIVFNSVDVSWTTSESAAGFGHRVDLQGVAAHEIGHALGLDHPWRRDATMFFSGGSAELRSLADDDERGACYLYPASAFEDGRVCDSCSEHGNCQSGACLSFPWEGSSFCGEPCSGQTCPTGFKCLSVEGVADQCVPEHDYCSPRGGNVPNGSYCWGPAMCARGQCIPVPEDAYCAPECNPSSSSGGCPSGFQCFPTAQGGGVCIKEGSKAFGEPCATLLECKSSSCQFGQCTQDCGAGNPCPGDALCTQGNCVVPGPSPYGSACTMHTECDTGYCTQPPNGFCSRQCGNNGDCPVGAKCNTRKYCTKVLLGDEGASCKDGPDCLPSLSCVRTSSTGDGSCARVCDPFEDAGCTPPSVCRWVQDAAGGDVRGTCIPAGNGGEQGAACAPGSAGCQRHLICVETSPGQGVCARDCRLADGLGCADPAQCTPLSSGDPGERGICDPTTGGGATQPDTGSAPGDAGGTGQSDAGGTPGTPGQPGADPGAGVPGSADAAGGAQSADGRTLPSGPVVHPGPGPVGGGSGGCTAARHGHGRDALRILWLLLLFFGLRCLLRIRRARTRAFTST